MAHYSSQPRYYEGGPKNPPEKHTCEAPCACFLRPVWGECWEIGNWAIVMAYGTVPITMET